jgi:hypothetical protein
MITQMKLLQETRYSYVESIVGQDLAVGFNYLERIDSLYNLLEKAIDTCLIHCRNLYYLDQKSS